MSQFTAKSVLPICALLAVVSRTSSAENGNRQAVSFVRDVAPILVRSCQACHGVKTAESNYRLDTFAAFVRPGDFEQPTVTAGDLENSEIYQLITADDPEERMPNNGGRLAESEVQTIANWIVQGAKFDGQDPAAPLRAQIPPDVPHPAAPETYPKAIPITAMTFSPDGSQLLVCGYHEILVWDAATGTLAARVGNVPQRTFGLALSPDGSWLAIAGGSPGVAGEVRLIPWHDGPKPDADPKVLATSEDVFFDVAFRPDGQQLAAAGADATIRVYEVQSGLQRLKINNHADWVTHICFSPDGKRIATASRDKTAKVFDAETGALLATYSEHDAPVRAVAFAADGKQVISAGGNRIQVWNAEDGKRVGELTGFGNDVCALLVRGGNIVAGSADRSAREFELQDRKLLHSLTDHPAWVLSLAWHEPTHRMATGCFDGTVTIWDLQNGTKLKQFVAMPPGMAAKD